MIFIAFFLSFPLVRADGWDDFSNNLASDLAPVVSLFGEQVTKQYLSESISFLDYFIFAMAPIGILTAVVSAIRVCGSPSLRAFIGRAQEGRGSAEVELCSSTSRDVCELYQNGGIARVFGRSKILEVIYDPWQDEHVYNEKMGLYTSQEYLEGKGKGTWYRKNMKGAKKPGKSEQIENPEQGQGDEPPHAEFAPNLSLNIGIKRQHPAILWGVAICGLVLQTGVLAFAGVATYYWKWEKDDARPQPYACPLVIIGTLLLCGGMFLCAFLVGQSTDDEVWCRGDSKSSMYWVQPGGQIVGDQTFDAFCYGDGDDSKDRLMEYTISWKSSRADDYKLAVWAAVGTSVFGFVLQFIGLRGVHSAISVAQLGAIMLMSAIRAALRAQRLEPDANSFANNPDEVIGHELDWLALRIGRRYMQDSLKLSPDPSLASTATNAQRRYFWRFCGTPDPREENIHQFIPSWSPNPARKLLAYRTRLAQLTNSSITSSRAFKVQMVEVREKAEQLAIAIESTVNTIYSPSHRIKVKWRRADSMWWGISCEITSESQSTAFTETRNQYPLYLRLRRKGQEDRWRLENRLELEGLLGLWVWSLKSHPFVETLDPQSQLTISRATEIPVKRIVSTMVNAPGLGPWCHRNFWGFGVEKIDPQSADFSRPGSIWKDEEDAYKPYVYRLPNDLSSPPMFRLFGWYAAEQTIEPFTAYLDPVSENSSLVSLCAQEIYGSFIASVLEVVDDTGSVDIKETGDFRLENDLVSGIVGAFTESNLGPAAEALLCVMPPMVSKLGLSFAERALVAARESANQHRKSGKWIDAKNVLNWVTDFCFKNYTTKNIDRSATLCERALITLAELYRQALRVDAYGDGRFGLDGIEFITSYYKGRLNLTCIPLFDRYRDIANGVSKHLPHAECDVNGLGLLNAIEKGLTETLLYLTVTTTIPEREQEAALFMVARRGWCEVMDVLFEQGMELELKDNKDRTALSHAAEAGNIEAVKELMDRGAFPQTSNRKGWTPLAYASKNGHHVITGILLRDSRVNIDSKDQHGQTPLFRAVECGNAAIVELLLDYKANIQLRDNEQNWPLFLAAENGNEAIVKMLLEAGANDYYDYGHRYKPLLISAEKGHENVVQLLLEANNLGIDVVSASKALFMAVKQGHVAVAELLLDTVTVDINMKDKEGNTALSWAVEMGNNEMEGLLRECGAEDSPENGFE